MSCQVVYGHEADLPQAPPTDVLDQEAVSPVYRLIRHTLCEAFSLQRPHRLTLSRSALGKPRFRYCGRHFHFSVSYSRGRYAFAFSARHEVGIDLEVPGFRRAGFFSNVIAQTFSAEERIRAGTPIDRAYFWRAWTAKEAFVKYTGTGLSRDVSTVVYQDDRVAVEGTDQPAQLVEMIVPGAALALVTAPEVAVRMRTWPMDDGNHRVTRVLPIVTRHEEVLG